MGMAFACAAISLAACRVPSGGRSVVPGATPSRDPEVAAAGDRSPAEFGGIPPRSHDPQTGTPRNEESSGEKTARFDPALTSLLEQATLPELPEWTDRWFDTKTSEQRHFAIDVLMRELDVDRAIAVELQNHHRDAMRADPGLDPRVAFTHAVAHARAGVFEDERARERLAAARVIVVFDLDETLYDQSSTLDVTGEAARGCTVLQVRPSQASPGSPGAAGAARRVVLAPGWERAFDRIHALGGVVVLFTANLDDLTWDNLRRWSWREGTVLEHPAMAGVLTNSHLVRRSRHEPETVEIEDAAAGRRRPVWMEPSKDLRIVDETLSRVVLVDDNPHRVAQLDRVRVAPKLDADVVCGGGGRGPASRRSTSPRGGGAPPVPPGQPSLVTIVDEIEGSLRWAEENDVSFAAAHLPYTLMGRVLVDEVQANLGWTRARAIEWVRRNPSRVARDF